MKKLALTLALFASFALPALLVASKDAEAGGSPLTCGASHGDVAQTVYVSNSTSSPVGKAGSQILWTRTTKVNGATNSGTITLDKPLCAKGVKSNGSCQELAAQYVEPGNGFECTANWKVTFRKL